MAERRALRGLQVPSFWQIIVIGAALVAAWLVYSEYGRHSVDPDEAVAGNPLESLYALEAYLRREADPVPRLLLGLDSQDPKERKLAADGLGKIGPAAGQALDKLCERIADDNAQVRANAALALTRISPDKESAAAAIAPLLADSESAVRQSVGKALFEIWPSAVKPLLEMLHSDRPATRFETIRVLRNTNPHGMSLSQNQWESMRVDLIDAVSRSLIEMLNSDQPAIRLEAVRLLQFVPFGAKWASLRADLGDLFNDPDPGVRIEAITAAAAWGVASPEQVRELLQDPGRVSTAFHAIGKLGQDAAPLLPDLLALLDDQTAFAAPPDRNAHPVPQRLQSVLFALSAMKMAALPAADRLIEIGNTRRDYACISIAETLHAIGAEEDKIGGVLAPLLLDPDPARGLSWSAGRSMVEFCPGAARRQVSQLIPKLESSDTPIDKPVLYALYALGPVAQEAVPAVVPLLQNRDSWIAEFAAHMLGAAGIGSRDVVGNLAQVAGNRSKPINQRLACANALEIIGPPAQSAVPVLIKILGEAEPVAPIAPLPGNPDYAERSARPAIIRALGRIGGDDEGLIPVLRSQLSRRSAEVRAAAAEALGRVASSSAEALADLIRRLRDEDGGVRVMAALAIGRIAPGRTLVDQESAVVPLINALADEYPFVRQAAVISVGKIGPAAKAALPALRELLVEQQASPASFQSERPHSLHQFDEISGLNGNSVQQNARTAIDQIENRAENE